MKKTVGRVLVVTMALSVWLLASCTMLLPSGIIVQKDFDNTAFTELEISSTFDCTITQGATWSVQVTVDQNVAESIEITQTDSTLSIGLKPMVGMSGAFSPMKVAITMPSLVSVTASGASKALCSGFNQASDSLAVDASGASTIGLDNGTIKTLNAEASGASAISLDSFTGNDISLTISGASRLSGKSGNVNFKNLVIAGSGASSVELDVSDSLSGELSGASSLHYGLSPSNLVITDFTSCVSAR